MNKQGHWGYLIGLIILLSLSLSSYRLAQGAELVIWKTEPPNVSVARLRAVAQALGTTGTISEDDEALQMQGARIGPSGSVAIQAYRSQLDIDGATGSHGSQCSNGADDNGDGLIDIDDSLCVSEIDADESAAGYQALNLNDTIVLSGVLQASGKIRLGLSHGAPIPVKQSAGRTIYGKLVAVSDGEARIDLQANRLVIDLPARLEFTCQGSGCFSGSCSADVGTIRLSSDGANGEEYSPISGTVKLDGRFVVPPVNQCHGGGQASLIDQALGLPASTAGLVLAAQLEPLVQETGTTLTLFKKSGVLVYDDPEALMIAEATPILPDVADARARADQLLTKLAIVVPNADVEVFSVDGENRLGQAVKKFVRVSYAPRLKVYAQSNSTLAPVLDAYVHVDYGAGGKLVGFESRWRHATQFSTVPERDADQVWQGLDHKITVSLPRNQITLKPVYFAFQPELTQSYYDPVFAATDAQDNYYGFEAATDFTPRITKLEPAGQAEVDGSQPIQFEVAAEAGRPPYQFRWVSDVAGDLGAGHALAVPLSNGPHGIGVAVADQNNAGFQAWFPINVFNSPVPAQVQAATPITGTKALKSSNGTKFTVTTSKKHRAPRIGRVTRRGLVFLETVYLEQWRYTLTVKINGVEYTLRSDKCIDGPVNGNGACYAPSPPFAVVATANPPASAGSVGGATSITKKVTINNLPGTFVLDFKYKVASVSNAACGGSYMERISSFLDITVSRTVGGKCPGFLPTVEWTYAPPTTQGIIGEDILRWCERHNGYSYDRYKYCIIPNNILGVISPTQYYQVTGFTAEIFTAMVPQSPSTRQATALAQDTTSLVMLGHTDGAINKKKQAWFAALNPLTPHAFTRIEPMARERTVTVARPVSRRGEYDNFHSKAAFFGTKPMVEFPGCNNARDKKDTAPCVHMHESWFAGPSFHKGQSVGWTIVRDRASERFPRGYPQRLSNNEVLFGNGRYQDILLWHNSTASSAACDPSGGVDNTNLPCKVFVSPIFFTH